MSDLIYLAVTVGFFAVAYALLRACEHLIGPDPIGASTPSTDAAADPAAADGQAVTR